MARYMKRYEEKVEQGPSFDAARQQSVAYKRLTAEWRTAYRAGQRKAARA